uniref:Uncharacterized protein n=1 Tax=Oryza glumipatula TaxID=40148 RepID=A0A0D9Y8W5_9ORYZ
MVWLLDLAGGVLDDETKQAEASPMPSVAAATAEWSSRPKMENGLTLRTVGAIGCATNGDPALDVPGFYVRGSRSPHHCPSSH